MRRASTPAKTAGEVRSATGGRYSWPGRPSSGGAAGLISRRVCRVRSAAPCPLGVRLDRPKMSAEGVRRDKAALSSGASPTRQPLQPEATGAVMEVTKWLKPSISVSRIGDSASVQAATRVNAEQASKRTMCRPTRLPYRGRLIRRRHGRRGDVAPDPERGRGPAARRRSPAGGGDAALTRTPLRSLRDPPTKWGLPKKSESVKK